MTNIEKEKNIFLTQIKILDLQILFLKNEDIKKNCGKKFIENWVSSLEAEKFSLYSEFYLKNTGDIYMRKEKKYDT